MSTTIKNRPADDQAYGVSPYVGVNSNLEAWYRRFLAGEVVVPGLTIAIKLKDGRKFDKPVTKNHNAKKPQLAKIQLAASVRK